MLRTMSCVGFLTATLAVPAFAASFTPYEFRLDPWGNQVPAHLPFNDGSMTANGQNFEYADGTTPFEVEGGYTIENYGVDDAFLSALDIKVHIPISDASSSYPDRQTLVYGLDDIDYIAEHFSEDQIHIPGLVWPKDRIYFDERVVDNPDGTGFYVRTALGLGWDLSGDPDDVMINLANYTIQVSVWCTGVYLFADDCNPGPMFDLVESPYSISDPLWEPTAGVIYSSGQVSLVPVPAAAPLLIGALAGLGGLRWRRKRRC